MKRIASCLGLVWLLTSCGGDSPQDNPQGSLGDDASVPALDAAMDTNRDGSLARPDARPIGTNTQPPDGGDAAVGQAPFLGADAAVVPPLDAASPFDAMVDRGGIDAGSSDDAATPSDRQPRDPDLTVSTPSVSRDDTAGTVCIPLKAANDDQCFDPYCIDAVRSITANATIGYGFYCNAGDCDPTPRAYGVSTADSEGAVDLFVRFIEGVTPDSASDALRSRLASVSGETRNGDFENFYSDPSLVETIENVGGRLHVVGWGKVYGATNLQPSIPRVCGGEIPKLCSWVQCNYGQDGADAYTFTGYAWVHYDVEAHFGVLPDAN